MMLARTLGIPNVQAMLESMTPEQFNDWVYEYGRRPWDCGWLPDEAEKEHPIEGSLEVFRRQAGV